MEPWFPHKGIVPPPGGGCKDFWELAGIRRNSLESLNPQDAPESTDAVITVCAVVVNKDTVIPPVAEQGASQFPDRIRRPEPAGGLAVEGTEFL